MPPPPSQNWGFSHLIVTGVPFVLFVVCNLDDTDVMISDG